MNQGTRQRLFVMRIVLIAGLLYLWEFSSGRFVNELFLSSPTRVASRLVTWFSTGEIWTHISITLQEMGYGLAIGTVLGLLLGLALGSSRFLSDVLGPYISAAYSIPKLALVPLLIIWFGIGITSKVVMVSMVAFFLIFFTVYSGTQGADERMRDSLVMMGASRVQLLTMFYLPASLLWLLAGMRLAIPYSLIAAVVAEFLGSRRGLGYLVAQGSGMLDTATVFGALTLIATLSLIISSIRTRIEKATTKWMATSETAQTNVTL
jgi:NitT/TauT family transport system permease protein